MTERFGLACLENTTYVVTCPTGLGTYDYEFVPDFSVSHPAILAEPVTAIARMGAAGDYAARYDELLTLGIGLIHTPVTYALCSELPKWYPHLGDLTARSIWFDERPTGIGVGRELGWPVFVKGARQTSKHQKSLCVAENADAFDRLMDAWATDPILRWQQIVCREWLNLRRVSDNAANLLPITFEFRSFWYRQQLVGFGNYWRTEPYGVSTGEQERAVSVAREAATRLNAPFVVIDLGMLDNGDWVVIECNDGQDAGYAGVDRRALWRRVIEIDLNHAGT